MPTSNSRTLRTHRVQVHYWVSKGAHGQVWVAWWVDFRLNAPRIGEHYLGYLLPRGTSWHITYHSTQPCPRDVDLRSMVHNNRRSALTMWIGDGGGAEPGARATPHEAEHVDAGQTSPSYAVGISCLVFCELLLQVLVDHPMHHGLAYPPVRRRHTLPKASDALQIIQVLFLLVCD